MARKTNAVTYTAQLFVPYILRAVKEQQDLINGLRGLLQGLYLLNCVSFATRDPGRKQLPVWTYGVVVDHRAVWED